MSVAVLVPTLRRPDNIAPLVQSLDATTTGHRAVFIADPGDRATHQAIHAAGADLLVCGGTYAKKINRAAAVATETMLFLGADDLRFHRHWLERALAKMAGPIRVVGTNDLGNPRVMQGKHATHFLVDRDYLELGTIDERGQLLHEGYRHCFCDDEFLATARKRQAYAFAGDSHVEHLHPYWEKGKTDDIYALGERSFATDRRTFRTRRRLWI